MTASESAAVDEGTVLVAIAVVLRRVQDQIEAEIRIVPRLRMGILLETIAIGGIVIEVIQQKESDTSPEILPEI